MSRNRFTILDHAAHSAALSLVLCVIVGCYLYPDAMQPAPPAPAPPVPAHVVSVTADLKAVSQELRAHPKDAATLAAYFEALADVVGRDSSEIKTTGQLRRGVEASGKLLIQNSGYAGYPVLRQAYEGLMRQELGMQDRPLDQAARTKAVAVFRAIAKACRGEA
jgi:hypothetical protein